MLHASFKSLSNFHAIIDIDVIIILQGESSYFSLPIFY